MNYNSFITSSSNNEPPVSDSDLLIAMWHALKGNWDKAHEIVQEIDSMQASWIHAYLHRVEGDINNAKYWYKRAKYDTFNLSIDKESETIIMNQSQ